MTPDPVLLDKLVCPVTRTRLRYDAAAQELISDSAGLAYPIRGGVPGRTASAVRRFGMGLIDRIAPLKDRLMAEARGESGELPLLLRGLPI